MPRGDPQRAFVGLNKHSEKASLEFHAGLNGSAFGDIECHTQVNINKNTLHHFSALKTNER